MKSEAAEKDSTKIDSRQSIHRRKMSKNSSIVNGADESLSYAAEDESLVRQINLAAAFHDHISCTKSAELCKIDGTREPKVSLPFETDHIYANCGEKKNKSMFVNSPTSPSTTKEWAAAELRRLRTCIIVQTQMIKKLEHDLAQKDNLISAQKLELESLKSCLEKRERMCVLRKRSPKPECTETNLSEVKNPGLEINNTTPITTITSTTSTVTTPTVPVDHSHSAPSVKLVTRYIGRGSKNIPSRALKRRILGLPKTVTSKQPTQKYLSSATSFSSESEVHEEETIPKPEVPKETKPAPVKTPLLDIKKISRKRCKMPKAVRKKFYVTTNEAYYLADNQTSSTSLVCSETLIDVPSWKLKPVTSFYQMEGTENINDPVFQRRHLKCEQDERRRKRWDIQRLREQKVSEKLKYKYCRDAEKESENNVQKKSQSFYPDPRHIQFIEVTNELPVLAFGHLIPLFQPSDFSLPWKNGGSHPSEPTEASTTKLAKRSRLSSAAPKVT